MAVLTASAVIIFIIEAQIPVPIPAPGVKLGLANAVTLFALFYGARQGHGKHGAGSSKQGDDSKRGDSSSKQEAGSEHGGDFSKQGADSSALLTKFDVFGILLCRIFLGAVFTGRLVAFAYSLAGGLIGFAAQVVMMRFVSKKQIWVCGAIGAVFHNIGQILAAMLITGTPAIAYYLPILIIAGIVTGVVTGLIAQFTLARVRVSRTDVNKK